MNTGMTKPTFEFIREKVWKMMLVSIFMNLCHLALKIFELVVSGTTSFFYNSSKM